jgi:hypothetical protein
MMERLTAWNKIGEPIFNKYMGAPYMRKCFENNGCPNMGTDKCNFCEHYIAIFAKLAAYEDTGLSPERVAELGKGNIPAAIDRLVEYESLIPLETAREWVNAYEDGRLVVLPCKVGDIVYIPHIGKVIERVIKDFRIDEFNPTMNIGTHYIGMKMIGKTVFLTRAEAEAALEKMKGGGEV